MKYDLDQFFQLIRIHHRLPPASRFNDLLGRLSAMADPANQAFKVTDLTRRCLRRFIDRRVQVSGGPT